jgi:hypothetical protein
LRFAYADPPYIGQAKRHYSHDPRCAEVDHATLIARMNAEFPDGWALSASSPSLGVIVPLLPDGWRIGAWCKSFCAFKKGVRPAYALQAGAEALTRSCSRCKDFRKNQCNGPLSPLYIRYFTDRDAESVSCNRFVRKGE